MHAGGNACSSLLAIFQYDMLSSHEDTDYPETYTLQQVAAEALAAARTRKLCGAGGGRGSRRCGAGRPAAGAAAARCEAGAAGLRRAGSGCPAPARAGAPGSLCRRPCEGLANPHTG